MKRDQCKSDLSRPGRNLPDIPYCRLASIWAINNSILQCGEYLEGTTTHLSPALEWISAPTGRHHHSLGQHPRSRVTPPIPAPTGRPNRDGGAA